MLQSFRNPKGQVVSSEYVLTFFIIVSMTVAMTIYFRRGVQARIHDTQLYVMNQVIDVGKETNSFKAGNFYAHYEPYYANTESSVERDSNNVDRLLPGKTSGIYRKEIDETTRVQTNSTTAAPREAN